MSKFKKILAIALSLAMACLFATSAFAATTAEKEAKIRAYAASNGVDISKVTLTESQINAIAANWQSLEAQADSLLAQAKSDPNNLQTYANQAASLAATVGITASVTSVAIDSTGKIVATATVNGSTATAAEQVATGVSYKATTDEHPEIAAAIANGTWGQKSGTTAAAAVGSNPLVASGSSVIKATGDNSAALLIAAVLSVAGILGLAVRKSSAMAA